MNQGPSGTITFLFTDIAGSTRLWDTDREGMTASLATHDQIMRQAIEANGGKIFATGGDSFSAAFPTAAQAVEAAIMGQLGLENQDWEGPRITVRMGIHTGVADERDGDYFGPAVTRAARIMSLGHGRQTLLSATTAGLSRDHLEGRSTLADLGGHPLRDMERPEHLFELRVPGLPVIETPLAGSTGQVHLPEQLTSFVGRSGELAAVDELLTNSRTVTLTGVGGTGKTRLAIEVARRGSERFADGVWMSELASVRDERLILGQIADIWGLRAGEGATLMQVVSNYLSTRKLLLVVDNCEHVLDPVSRLLTELLSLSPGLSILATSRESLGIPGEAVYRVPSMQMPGDDERARDSDAVTLFLDRVRKVQPEFSPNESDLDAIIEVCRRLDGIPLALELAAARLRSLTPVELLGRLHDSFRILTGGAKSALPRQRTLQAAIDWSYDLLDPRERRLFRHASVFVGGFDLDAINAVVQSSELEEWQILDLVDQLADKSLLIADVGTTRSRFRMLEPIRQYAQERLASDQKSEEVHSAHADYYEAIVSHAEPRLRGFEQKVAHEEIRLELDNIRQALAYLRDTDQLERFLAMCFDLTWFWTQASMQVEALDLLLPCLESSPQVEPSLHAKAWWTASQLAFNLTDSTSVEYAENGLEIATHAGDEIAMGWTSVAAAMAIRGTDDRTDAVELYTRGEKLVRGNLDRSWWDQAWDEILLGWARAFVGAAPASEQMNDIAKTVAEAKAAGDMFVAAGVMTSAYFMRDGDDDPRALAFLKEAVEILRGLGFRHAYGHALMYWGRLARDSEDEIAGESAMISSAEILAEIGDIPCSLGASRNLISHLIESDRLEEAVPRLAFAARNARTDPERFLPWVTGVACQAAAEMGDLTTAAIILGYESARKSSESSPGAVECRAVIEDGLSEDELSRLKQQGSLMHTAQVLELVESWADQTIFDTRGRPHT